MQKIVEAAREADKPKTFVEKIEEAARSIFDFLKSFPYGSPELLGLAKKIAEVLSV